MLAHDAPRRFSHTVCYTRYRDPAFIVIYELREARIEVELTLTLEELPLGTRTAEFSLPAEMLAERWPLEARRTTTTLIKS